MFHHTALGSNTDRAWVETPRIPPSVVSPDKPYSIACSDDQWTCQGAQCWSGSFGPCFGFPDGRRFPTAGIKMADCGTVAHTAAPWHEQRGADADSSWVMTRERRTNEVRRSNFSPGIRHAAAIRIRYSGGTNFVRGGASWWSGSELLGTRGGPGVPGERGLGARSGSSQPLSSRRRIVHRRRPG